MDTNNTASLTMNDFEASFAELAKLEDDAPANITTKPEPAPAPAVAAEPAPAPAAAAEPAPVEEAEALEDLSEEEKAAAAAANEPDPATKQHTQAPDTDVLRRLADMLSEGRPQPQANVQQQVTQPQPALFSQDEMAALQQFQKEWPEVAVAQSLMIRAAVTQTTQHIFSEIARTLGPKLQMLDGLADHTMEQQLNTAIPDYSTVRDKVVDWVGKQPPYLQAAYNHVIEQGSVDEVRDLIDRYKRDAGAVQQQGGGTPQAQATPAPAKKPAAELSNAAKQAAAKLAPISTKRSVVVQATDPLDFDGAFAEAAKALAANT